MSGEGRIKINIAICDDEPIMIQKIKNICEAVLGEDLYIHIEIANSAEELLQKNTLFQIAILNVQLPERDGIDLARELMMRDANCRIIFTGGFSGTISDVYKVPHFCFILKEQLEIQLPHFLKRAASLAAEDAGKFISVLCGKKVEKILLSNLVMLERRGHNTFFTLFDGVKLQSKEKLSDLLQRIGNPNFVRCHISYAVNLSYVEKEEDNGFRLKTGQWIPVSRPNHQYCREALWCYLSEQMQTYKKEWR